MFERLIALMLKRPALSITVGVSAVLSAALVTHFAIENQFATDFSVYWRTASEPASLAYKARSSLPFPYPPTMMLWIAPLAIVPMWVAFAIWVSVSIAAIIAACRNYLGWPEIGLVIISPPLVNGLSTGQVSTALAALLLWACGTRNRIVAGLAFAVIATIKPQLVIMAPLLFLLNSDFRALFASAFGFLSIIAVSIAAFGLTSWWDWLQSMDNFHAVLVKDNVLGVAITPAAAAAHLRLPPTPFLVIGALAGVWLIYRCRRMTGMEASAAIATSSLLAAPYALTYDLAALAPFLVWAAFRDRKSPAIALAGVLNPLPLLLTGRILNDQLAREAPIRPIAAASAPQE